MKFDEDLQKWLVKKACFAGKDFESYVSHLEFANLLWNCSLLFSFGLGLGCAYSIYYVFKSLKNDTKPRYEQMEGNSHEERVSNLRILREKIERENLKFWNQMKFAGLVGLSLGIMVKKDWLMRKCWHQGTFDLFFFGSSID